MISRPTTILEVLEDKILIDDGCWEWKGFKNSAGYGLVDHHVGSRSVRRAHRLVYELLVGPIPEGLTLDHLCRNRGCGRPSHLEPVSISENVRRGVHWRPAVYSTSPGAIYMRAYRARRK